MDELAMSSTVVLKSMLPLRTAGVIALLTPSQYLPTTTRQRNMLFTPWASGVA